MMEIIRFCLLIPIAGTALSCLLLSVGNLGFVDTFPWLLLVLFLVPALVLLPILLLVRWFLIWHKRFLSFYDRFFCVLGSWRSFAIAVSFSILVYLVLFLTASLYNRCSLGGKAPRLLVIGLDGASWDLIDPLMEAGRLPHLQRLCDRGTRMTLLSSPPMRSPRLWTTIASGVSPEIHGITGFFSTQADLKTPRIWEICEAEGLRTGLFSWMVTWPPQSRSAFKIPSWFARSPQTYPSSYTCAQEIYLDQDREGGAVKPWRSLWQCAWMGARLDGIQRMAFFYTRDRFGISEKERLYRKMMAEARLRTDLFHSLLTRYTPDVAAFCLYGSDKLAHRFWDSMEPGAFSETGVQPDKNYANVITDYYLEADRAMGRILTTLSPSTTIAVLSDHGLEADTAYPRQFFLDVEGLLRLFKAERNFHFKNIMRQVILTPINLSREEIDTFVKVLEIIQFEESDEPVFLVEINEAGEIVLRTNFSLTWNPDSPILTEKNIRIGDLTAPVESIFFQRAFPGKHKLEGILLLAGPQIKAKATAPDANQVDAAPTLLYLLGLPISREIEGNILVNALKEGLLTERPPQYTDRYELDTMFESNSEMNEPLLERLRSLNYVQ